MISQQVIASAAVWVTLHPGLFGFISGLAAGMATGWLGIEVDLREHRA